MLYQPNLIVKPHFRLGWSPIFSHFQQPKDWKPWCRWLITWNKRWLFLSSGWEKIPRPCVFGEKKLLVSVGFYYITTKTTGFIKGVCMYVYIYMCVCVCVTQTISYRNMQHIFSCGNNQLHMLLLFTMVGLDKGTFCRKPGVYSIGIPVKRRYCTI